MSTFPKKDYPVKWLPVGILRVVWPEAQRPEHDVNAKKIAEDFDPDVFGVLTVAGPMEDGMYHIIDGQTRWLAVRQMWGEKELVPCTVLNVTEPAVAAEIFLRINGGRTKPQALDNFRVGVTAGREAETAVNHIIKARGYRLGWDSTDGALSAVTACLQIYRKHGPEVLDDALRTIQATWGKARDSVHQNVIQGFAELVAEHNGSIDRKRLADKLSKKFTPARFIGAARQAKDFQGGTLTAAARSVLIKTYNSGLAADRHLPE